MLVFILVPVTLAVALPIGGPSPAGAQVSGATGTPPAKLAKTSTS